MNNKPIPHETYDGLKLQFLSSMRIIRLLERRLEDLTLRNNELLHSSMIAANTLDELNSLRDINEQLTNRVLELESTIEDLTYEIKETWERWGG